MGKKLDFRGTRSIRLLRALVEVRERVRQIDDARIETYGLSPREFDCLVTLGVGQPLRMGELAERSLLTKSHTTQVVKQLENRGLARRQRSPESDREVLATLSAQGQVLFEDVYPKHHRFLTEWFDGVLSAEEQEDLAALLRKMVP